MERNHREEHYVARVGWLRAAVLGANDGIVSTASLIVGVAAASGRTRFWSRVRPVSLRVPFRWRWANTSVYRRSRTPRQLMLNANGPRLQRTPKRSCEPWWPSTRRGGAG